MYSQEGEHDMLYIERRQKVEDAEAFKGLSAVSCVVRARAIFSLPDLRGDENGCLYVREVARSTFDAEAPAVTRSIVSASEGRRELPPRPFEDDPEGLQQRK